MEQLCVTNLLGGALAAISGAVVASFFGVFGTLAGAGVMSIFMAVATARVRPLTRVRPPMAAPHARPQGGR